MTPKEKIQDLEARLSALRVVSESQAAIAAEMRPKLDAATASVVEVTRERDKATKDLQAMGIVTASRQNEINDAASLLDGLGVPREIKREGESWVPSMSLVARIALLAARGVAR